MAQAQQISPNQVKGLKESLKQLDSLVPIKKLGDNLELESDGTLIVTGVPDQDESEGESEGDTPTGGLASGVADVVKTFAQLAEYDTSSIAPDSIVIVSKDSYNSGDETFYRWDGNEVDESRPFDPMPSLAHLAFPANGQWTLPDPTGFVIDNTASTITVPVVTDPGVSPVGFAGIESSAIDDLQADGFTVFIRKTTNTSSSTFKASLMNTTSSYIENLTMDGSWNRVYCGPTNENWNYVYHSTFQPCVFMSSDFDSLQGTYEIHLFLGNLTQFPTDYYTVATYPWQVIDGIPNVTERTASGDLLIGVGEKNSRHLRNLAGKNVFIGEKSEVYYADSTNISQNLIINGQIEKPETASEHQVYNNTILGGRLYVDVMNGIEVGYHNHNIIIGEEAMIDGGGNNIVLGGRVQGNWATNSYTRGAFVVGGMGGMGGMASADDAIAIHGSVFEVKGIAIGNGAHVGNGRSDDAQSSIAIGASSSCADFSTAVGAHTISYTFSQTTAFGFRARVYSDYDIALGYGAVTRYALDPSMDTTDGAWDIPQRSHDYPELSVGTGYDFSEVTPIGEDEYEHGAFYTNPYYKGSVDWLKTVEIAQGAPQFRYIANVAPGEFDNDVVVVKQLTESLQELKQYVDTQLGDIKAVLDAIDVGNGGDSEGGEAIDLTELKEKLVALNTGVGA